MRSRTTTHSRTSAEARAAAIGTALNRLGKGFPGTIGPLLVATGLWLAWPPLGVITLGLILWALDRRIP